MRQPSFQDAAPLVDEKVFVPHVHKRASTADNTCGGCRSKGKGCVTEILFNQKLFFLDPCRSEAQLTLRVIKDISNKTKLVQNTIFKERRLAVNCSLNSYCNRLLLIVFQQKLRYIVQRSRLHYGL
jgi:hypothetical protein